MRMMAPHPKPALTAPSPFLAFTSNLQAASITSYAMSGTRSGSSISQRDRESLLQALRIEGFERVMRNKEKVLNKYFTSMKTRKEVDKILRYFTRKSKDYNPYLLKPVQEEDQGTNMSSHALSKWHHILPMPKPNVTDGLAAALEAISTTDDFSASERMVLNFMSTLLKTGGGHEMLDLPSVLLVVRLMQDLREEAVASQDSSWSLYVHMSQSFWELLQEKENGNVRVTDEEIDVNSMTNADIDSQAASLDPFQLSVRLKLIERFDQIVSESIRLTNELSQSNA